MMATTEPLGALIDKSYRPREPVADDEVWNLNLDQIEPHSGRVLSKCMLSASELGPSTFAFDRGTVLYSKLRPYLNKVVVADDDGVATTELVPLRCDESRLNAQYLAHFLRGQDFLRFATNVVAGAKMPRMVMSEFWKFPVPLPPIPEQRRIAAILDQADALRAKRREALAQLDSLTQSIFIEMFEGDAKTPIRSLGEVASLKRGPFGGALKKEIFVPVGALVFEQRNAIQDDCRSGRYFITEAKYREMEDFAVQAGDLIVSCSGTIGKVAVVPSDAPRGIINQALLRVRVNPTVAAPLYLKHALECVAVQEKLTGLSHGTGLQNFPPMGEVRALRIPMPTLPLQQKFEERLAGATRLRVLQDQSLRELDALFASLQHRAFAGQLS